MAKCVSCGDPTKGTFGYPGGLGRLCPTCYYRHRAEIVRDLVRSGIVTYAVDLVELDDEESDGR